MIGLPALLGALGFVFFGFGLLSAVLALFSPVTDLVWVLGNLGVGVALLVAAGATGFESLRERLSSGEGRRAGKYGSSAVSSTVLGIAILGMIAFLSVRYSTRFDWTDAKVHTLTDQTLEELSRLDQDVEVMAFFNALDAPWVRDLLQRYEYQSEHFLLTFVDPNRRPDIVNALGVDEADLARGLVRMSVGGTSASLKEFSESEITNNLVKLTRSGAKKIYFVSQHNERFFDGEEGESKEGYSRIVEALRQETYAVEPLVLATLEEVPPDADAVVIAGPTRPYLDHEHALLAHYLERGGALMVLVDPRAKTDLYEDLRSWGVELGEDVIVDRLQALFGQATSPMASDYAAHHPITLKLRERTIFPMARSVVVVDTAPGQLETIVATSDQSWAERDLDSWLETGRAEYDEGDDLLGPVPVAVAGRPVLAGTSADAVDAPNSDPRLVVFGDSDFATNEFVDAYLNRDLFLNAVNWLVGDTEFISLRPNVARASRFELSIEQLRNIQYLSLFVVPEGIAVIGVFAWWIRRRAPGG
jgi:ABC-type uncharacterized transport system involved in gliding motility auxiliary subunit